MISLTTDKLTELVFTADPDVKVKKKMPHRWIPIEEAKINGGVPLSFIVRSLNSFEQLEIMSAIASKTVDVSNETKKKTKNIENNPEETHVNFISPMLAALKIAVVEAKGDGFHKKESHDVLDILQRTPPTLLTLLGTWVTEHSWGSDPLSTGK
tara:strand:- start:64 stop:525 length:462 start_codon:yes stop_codon:yes gene_type:complete